MICVVTSYTNKYLRVCLVGHALYGLTICAVICSMVLKTLNTRKDCGPGAMLSIVWDDISFSIQNPPTCSLFPQGRHYFSRSNVPNSWLLPTEGHGPVLIGIVSSQYTRGCERILTSTSTARFYFKQW